MVNALSGEVSRVVGLALLPVYVTIWRLVNVSVTVSVAVMERQATSCALSTFCSTRSFSQSIGCSSSLRICFSLRNAASVFASSISPPFGYESLHIPHSFLLFILIVQRFRSIRGHGSTNYLSFLPYPPRDLSYLKSPSKSWSICMHADYLFPFYRVHRPQFNTINQLFAFFSSDSQLSAERFGYIAFTIFYWLAKAKFETKFYLLSAYCLL